MTLAGWRGRLAYIAMSAFVIWHTLAMVIAPAPDSRIKDAFLALFQPYLTVLRLNSQWDFFAPTVGEGSRLRYIIVDKAGVHRAFMPAEELSWFHPSYFWFRSWYYSIMDDPESHADFAAAQFCRKHAALLPVTITLLEVQEEKFTLADHMSGKRRTDSDFFTVKTLKSVRCPDN